MNIDYHLLLVIKSAILPPGAFVVSGLLGVLFIRHLIGRALLLLTPVGLYLISTPYVSDQLAQVIERHPPLTVSAAKSQQADAVLVLLAGRIETVPEWDYADIPGPLSTARIDYGARLHQALGIPLMVSGGLERDGHPALARIASQALRERWGITAVIEEDQSHDTWHNAKYSAQLLQERGLKRVLVVTHADHMSRAMFSLRHFGVDAIPAPMGHIHRKDAPESDPAWLDWVPSAGSLSANRYLLHEFLGLLWYRHFRA